MSVVPDSGVVNGRYELDYANEWDHPIDSLCLHLLPGVSIEIDSLSYLNAPVDPTGIVRSDSMLVIRLDQPIEPGRRGFIMLKYTAHLSGDSLILNWTTGVDLWGAWPVLCRQSVERGEWFDAAALGAVCDYEIGVSLDTSYILAHSGTLLDERQVYGLIPTVHDGEGVRDLLAIRDSSSELRRFVPQFDEGVREYVVRSRGVRGISLVVGSDLVLDRTKIDSTVVTVYRPRSVGRKVIEEFQKMLPLFIERLGLREDTVLSVIVADNIRQPVWQTGAVMLPSQLIDEETVDAAVAFGLAQQFVTVPDSYAMSDDVCQRYGAAYFAAADVLHELYGADGYRMVTTYENRLMQRMGQNGLRVLGCTSEMLPGVWEEAMYWYGWSSTESWVREESVWSSLREGVKALPAKADYRFEGGPGESGFVRVTTDSLLDFPPELGVLCAGRSDTVYVHAEGMTGATACVYYLGELGTVTQMIIDPNYRLYDTDLNNNYWYKIPRREHHAMPDDVFPALRRLQ